MKLNRRNNPIKQRCCRQQVPRLLSVLPIQGSCNPEVVRQQDNITISVVSTTQDTIGTCSLISYISVLPDQLQRSAQEVFTTPASQENAKPVSPKRSVFHPFSRGNQHRLVSKAFLVWKRLNHTIVTSYDGQKKRKLRKPMPSDSLVRMSHTGNDPVRSSYTSPLSVIQRRLNESDNMNKKKVQKMIGGKFNRKPVANSSGALRLATTVALQQFRDTSSDYSNEGNSMSDYIEFSKEDPFQTEHGFEDNLEDRILGSSPAGCSTPKVSRRCCFSLMDISCPITASTEEPLVTSEVDRVVGSSPGLHSMSEVSLESFLSKSPEESSSTKKHPSPSKSALENLERAFRSYVKACGTNADQQ